MIRLDEIVATQGDFSLSVKSLSIKESGLVAVLGNNGSGKTTFLSLLSGLKSYEGSYELSGKDFGSYSAKSAGEILSLLPQSGALNMPFDVFYVVLTGRFIHTDGRSYSKEDFDETERVMIETDIMHLKERPFNELSGGEKQRVLLARTINKDTKVLLLDEPFSDTDILHQHKLIGLLKELAKKKLIIVVIHDLSLAIREFERFLFFESGTLSYDVTPEEIDEERLSSIFGVRVKFIKEASKLFIYTEEV